MRSASVAMGEEQRGLVVAQAVLDDSGMSCANFRE